MRTTKKTDREDKTPGVAASETLRPALSLLFLASRITMQAVCLEMQKAGRGETRTAGGSVGNGPDASRIGESK